VNSEESSAEYFPIQLIKTNFNVSYSGKEVRKRGNIFQCLIKENIAVSELQAVREKSADGALEVGC
jgi:hypothetical protein